MRTPTGHTIDMRTVMHTRLVDAVYSNVIRWVEHPRREWKLPNGKIADILFDYLGYEIIIEIKSVLKQSVINDAISKYWSQCDLLIIAAPTGQFPKSPDRSELLWGDGMADKIGHLEIADSGLRLTRPPSLLRPEKARQR